MSFCPHHVYNARYCQVCTPGSGGGLISPASPGPALEPAAIESFEPKPRCPKCTSKHYRLYAVLNMWYCTQCAYEEEE